VVCINRRLLLAICSRSTMIVKVVALFAVTGSVMAIPPENNVRRFCVCVCVCVCVCAGVFE
jgi:hypothetical protein